MLSLRHCLFIACISILVGCAPQHFDAKTEGDRLFQRDAEWAEIAAAGRDVEKTVSYWSEDAILIPEGQSIVQGRVNIRKYVSESFRTPGFHIHWKSARPTFSPDGELAYMLSDTTITAPGPSGTVQSFPSRAVTVWRRDPDGQWRCVVDTWNDAPGPSTVGK
jgi:ketosteroid isomerase-like protein